MQHIILFDTDTRESLLPFTFTRPVCDLRLGILTIEEKWKQLHSEIQQSIKGQLLHCHFEIGKGQKKLALGLLKLINIEINK